MSASLRVLTVGMTIFSIIIALLLLDVIFGQANREDVGRCRAESLVLTETATRAGISRIVDRAKVSCPQLALRMEDSIIWIEDKKFCSDPNSKFCRDRILADLSNTRIGDVFKCTQVIYTDYSRYLKVFWIENCARKTD